MPSRAAQIAALSLPLDQLPDPLPIPTIEKPFDVTIRPPGSKSITNRALLLAALADGTSELRGPLIDADDAQVMLRAIQQLGAKVEFKRAPSVSSGTLTPDAQRPPPTLDILRITGVNGRWRIPGGAGQTITLNLNNAGTATRFLTAAAILAPHDSGGIIIDGDARMRQRPIGELVSLLTQLGVRTEFLGQTGFPPVRVLAPADLSQLRGLLAIGQTSSSQFISALLLAAPFLPRGLSLRFESRLTSQSYVRMSECLLTRVGAHVRKGTDRIVGVDAVADTRLPGFTLDIDPDLSGATFFWGAAAINPGSRISIGGMSESISPSIYQGDQEFLNVLGGDDFYSMGCDVAGEVVIGPAALRPVDVLLDDMPDTAMTAAVLACFASPTPDNPTGGATSTLRGLRTLRVKETDRLAALQTELTKLGATIEIIPETHNGNPDESLRITPPPHSALCTLHSALIFSTYHDHRMAMSLALIGLRRPNVLIQNPACVAKTYPTFWKDLAKLYS